MSTKTVNVDAEFIKLARAMRDAQKAGQHSQKEWRRAQNLAQLFDTKLETIEKVLAKVEPTPEPGPQLFNTKPN